MKRLLFLFLIVFLLSFLRLWHLNEPDLVPDELHYVEEAHRFYNQDPYISLRHHTFHHPDPHMGHPFLMGGLTSIFYKALGVSVFSARTLSALAGIATGFLFFVFLHDLGFLKTTSALLLYSLMPLSIRFARRAYLDSILTFFLTVCAICIWKYGKSQKTYWLIVAGISSGLAISTKIYGIFSLPLMVGCMYIVSDSQTLQARVKYLVKKSSIVGICVFITTWIFNDFTAYVDAIVNPSDPRAQIFSRAAALRLLNLSKDIFVRYEEFIPLFMSLLFVFSVIFIILTKRNRIHVFFLYWFLIAAIIAGVNQMGGSGPWGLQAAIIPVVFIISIAGNDFFRRRFRYALLAIVIGVMPFTYWYGVGFSHIPYAPLLQANRIMGDTFYQDVIQKVNFFAPNRARIYFWPKDNYPIFTLRGDLSWTYYGDLYDFDMLILDQSLAPDNEEFELVEKYMRFQDGAFLRRFIYRKKV